MMSVPIFMSYLYRWDPNWFTESSYDDRVTGWIVILNLRRTGDGSVATGFWGYCFSLFQWSLALLAWFSLVELSMFDHMIFFKMISSVQFAFAIGSSAAKQLWSLCRSHRLLGSKDAMYHATVCERTCSWAGCSYSVPICRPSPQLGAERSGGSTGVLAAIFETLHGEMEFVFGATRSSVKALTWEFTNLQHVFCLIRPFRV